jgi:hypothetical protein
VQHPWADRGRWDLEAAVSQYEYRLLQRRQRWVMSAPYDEWFRPWPRDYPTLAEARGQMRYWQDKAPEAEFKIQRRPPIRDWEDV